LKGGKGRKTKEKGKGTVPRVLRGKEGQGGRNSKEKRGGLRISPL